MSTKTSKCGPTGASRREPWGFKDPRAASLLPLYLKLFPRMNLIACTRDFPSVMKSFRTHFSDMMTEREMTAQILAREDNALNLDLNGATRTVLDFSALRSENWVMAQLEKTIKPRKTFKNLYGHYMGARNLNLGCGRNLEPDFFNLDSSPNVGAVIVWNLEDGLPIHWTTADGLEMHPEFKEHSWDLVLASHCLEHIRNLIPLMRDIHRILKPGGHLIAMTPYASSNDAWEDPTHVRAFTENSWMYFDRRTYEGDHHGNYDSPVDFVFSLRECSLIPHDEFQEESQRDPEAFHKRIQHERNMIREMHAILRAEK